MNCALWLNKKKITTAPEIPENLDIAALRGYFLGGSLVEWLSEHGGEDYAEKLSLLKPDDPELPDKIAVIFGGTPAALKRFGDGRHDFDSVCQTPCSFDVCGSFGAVSSGTAVCSYYGSGYGSLNLENFGSFFANSYFWGSFSEFAQFMWEWEWEFKRLLSGSFGFGSYEFGSFSLFERLFGNFRNFGSFGFGSFGSFGSFGGSENISADPLVMLANKLPELDEYDIIMLKTLLECPLDRFGYGIHNI